MTDRDTQTPLPEPMPLIGNDLIGQYLSPVVLDGLRTQGYAPGGYLVTCYSCNRTHGADKRSIRCLNCAIIAAVEGVRAEHDEPPPVDNDHVAPGCELFTSAKEPHPCRLCGAPRINVHPQQQVCAQCWDKAAARTRPQGEAVQVAGNSQCTHDDELSYPQIRHLGKGKYKCRLCKQELRLTRHAAHKRSNNEICYCVKHGGVGSHVNCVICLKELITAVCPQVVCPSPKCPGHATSEQAPQGEAAKCDCVVEALEGAGNHSPRCGIFRPATREQAPAVIFHNDAYCAVHHPKGKGRGECASCWQARSKTEQAPAEVVYLRVDEAAEQLANKIAKRFGWTYSEGIDDATQMIQAYGAQAEQRGYERGVAEYEKPDVTKDIQSRAACVMLDIRACIDEPEDLIAWAIADAVKEARQAGREEARKEIEWGRWLAERVIAKAETLTPGNVSHGRAQLLGMARDVLSKLSTPADKEE